VGEERTMSRRRKVNHCRRLLCFVVEDDDDVLELGSRFVFTTRERDARKIAAGEFSTDPGDPSVILRRAPEFDRYAPGPVPPQALLDAGWWITCAECEHHVSDDGCDDCANERVDDQPMPPPVVCGGMVFCSQDCKDDYDAARARDAKYKADMTRLALDTFPGATVLQVWGLAGRPKDLENSIDLQLPGVEGRVNWRPYDPDPKGCAFVRAMDIPAFQAYVAEHNVRVPRPDTDQPVVTDEAR
jgi:hypothetical protein